MRRCIVEGGEQGDLFRVGRPSLQQANANATCKAKTSDFHHLHATSDAVFKIGAITQLAYHREHVILVEGMRTVSVWNTTNDRLFLKSRFPVEAAGQGVFMCDMQVLASSAKKIIGKDTRKEDFFTIATLLSDGSVIVYTLDGHVLCENLQQNKAADRQLAGKQENQYRMCYIEPFLLYPIIANHPCSAIGIMHVPTGQSYKSYPFGDTTLIPCQFITIPDSVQLIINFDESQNEKRSNQRLIVLSQDGSLAVASLCGVHE